MDELKQKVLDFVNDKPWVVVGVAVVGIILILRLGFKRVMRLVTFKAKKQRGGIL